jgi:predicted transcriptional regulator
MADTDPSFFDEIDEAAAAADAEALAQLDAGEGIPHEETVAWLNSRAEGAKRPQTREASRTALYAAV